VAETSPNYGAVVERLTVRDGIIYLDFQGDLAGTSLTLTSDTKKDGTVFWTCTSGTLAETEIPDGCSQQK
jgi:hypothetical protein